MYLSNQVAQVIRMCAQNQLLIKKWFPQFAVEEPNWPGQSPELNPTKHRTGTPTVSQPFLPDIVRPH